MGKIILILCLFICNLGFAQEIDKKFTKKELPGDIINAKLSIESREKIVAEKEIYLSQFEKKLIENNEYLENSRKKLLAEAINVKLALENKEKDINKHEYIKNKRIKSTKKLGELIQEISNKNPISS